MIGLEGLKVGFRAFQLGPVDLVVPHGEFFMVMGPTGSGKTLLLETIAGLVSLDEGVVRINGRDVTNSPPGRRSVGIVYQDSALFPHLTVKQNILYGTRYISRESRFGFDPLVDLLDLGNLLDRFPGKLSGGEKQRTALARALITDPGVVLLDEPLSSLDQMFRGEIRRELRRLHRETGTTFMMTTHDFTDALSMGTSGLVIRDGSIEQEGNIEDLFDNPETPFMASFIGMKNVFPAVCASGKADVRGLAICHTSSKEGACFVAIPPESVVLSLQSAVTSERNRYRGRVTSIEQTSSTCNVSVTCQKDVVITSQVTRSALKELELESGSEVFISFKASAVHVF
ncbi:MAG: ABC transporter ATP-binding protein [Candidatus Fermentibacteraceae bacterium]|nr:ABC transporter ATP-binding protein [Candidatus Fermentibacteraceae bacterium]